MGAISQTNCNCTLQRLAVLMMNRSGLMIIVEPLVVIVDVQSVELFDIRNSLATLAWNFSRIVNWYDRRELDSGVILWRVREADRGRCGSRLTS